MKKLLFALTAILLAACQAPQQIPPDDSPFVRVPVGSTLTLNRDLTFAPYVLKVYVQGDRLAGDAARLYPYCIFELRQRSTTPYQIKADTFVVRRVRQDIDYIAGIDDPGRLYASRLFIRDSGDGPGLVTYATYLELESPNQPNVMRMTCAILQDYDLLSHHLSINQMRAAMGSTFELETPF